MTTATRTAPVPAGLRRSVNGRILTPVTVILAVVASIAALVRLAGGSIPVPLQLIPFAASILVFGLPHGAMDHLVPARIDSRLGTARSVATVVVIYIVVGGATFLLWTAAPVAGFIGFIALTLFHWGQGDLYIEHLLGAGPRSAAEAILTVVVRGAIPMLLPLVFFPEDYSAVFTDTVRAVAPGAALDPHVLLDDRTRVLAAVLVAVPTGLLLVAQRIRGGSVVRPLLETAVLVALFATTPPILAVGLYFTLWHVVRHILRLELTDPAASADLARGELARPYLRFLTSAWPLTLAAVALLAILAATLRTVDLGVYLVFIAALTTPHAVIVTWMDRRQRVWSPPG